MFFVKRQITKPIDILQIHSSKTIRIIGGPDDQNSDNWSSTVSFYLSEVFLGMPLTLKITPA